MALIISDNLVLTGPDAALPAGTPLILWDNIVTFGNISSASAAEDGYPLTNVSNPSTNQEWRAASVGSKTITITTGSANDVQAVGIARHNFGSSGITVEVGYTSGGWNNLAGPIVPGNDEPLLFHFTAQPLTTVEIKLSGGSVAPRMAVVYCGPLLTMERGVTIQDYAVPRFARKTEFYNARSERGDFLGRIITSQFIEGIEHAYKYLTPDWYRSKMVPFVLAAQQDRPFFYAFAPDDYPQEVAYAWLTGDPVGLTDPSTRRMHVTLPLGGIAE